MAAAVTVSFDAGAAAYEQFMGRWSRLWVPALLDGARVAPGHVVLDVAAGTGVASGPAATRVGPTGTVLATDTSLPMLAAARRRLAGTRATFLAMDGQALALRDATIDAVVCQLGLMFLGDLGVGLREAHRVLRPGRWLAAIVWSRPERVRFFSIVMEALARQRPDQRDALMVTFALGDPDRLDAALGAAGFRETRVAPVRQRVAFDSFEDYLAPIAAGGARAGQLYQSLPAAARRAADDEMRRELASFEQEGRLMLETEALLAIGRR
jgi:ubiquinone/menaquinone biosynthesis C-methylase UbiE